MTVFFVICEFWMLGTEQERVQDYFCSVILNLRCPLFFRKNRLLFGLGVLITKSSSKHYWYAYQDGNARKCRIWTRFLLFDGEEKMFNSLWSYRVANNMFERKHIHGWCVYFWRVWLCETHDESSWFSHTVFRFGGHLFLSYNLYKMNKGCCVFLDALFCSHILSRRVGRLECKFVLQWMTSVIRVSVEGRKKFSCSENGVPNDVFCTHFCLYRQIW